MKNIKFLSIPNSEQFFNARQKGYTRLLVIGQHSLSAAIVYGYLMELIKYKYLQNLVKLIKTRLFHLLTRFPKLSNILECIQCDSSRELIDSLFNEDMLQAEILELSSELAMQNDAETACKDLIRFSYELNIAFTIFTHNNTILEISEFRFKYHANIAIMQIHKNDDLETLLLYKQNNEQVAIYPKIFASQSKNEKALIDTIAFLSDILRQRKIHKEKSSRIFNYLLNIKENSSIN